MHALLLATLLCAAPTPPTQNVIFITWDGVRWQDFFHRGPDAPFRTFWARHAADSAVFGDPETTSRFEVSNHAFMSLPSYQEMMVGDAVPCSSNDCERVQQKTLIDALVSKGFTASVVASWEKIAFATSAKPHDFVNAGLHEGEPAPPWSEARRDAETWALAQRALAKQPRFLWISLNDADEWAHAGKKDNYVATLAQYDAWLDALVKSLSTMKGYGANTTIVVSTDHGRGDGPRWTDHTHLPAAGQAFAFVLRPGSKGAKPTASFTHRALRPTIEAILGLMPSGTPLSPIGQAK